MSLPNENPRLYTANKESQYYRDFIPRPMFEGIWAKAKMTALGFLCKIDPTHAALYQEYWPKIDEYLEMEFFKESMYEMFVGCVDLQSPMFNDMMRSAVAKIAGYGRFCIERLVHKEELDKVKLRHPMYIINLPRSGSTLTHRILANDPKSSPMLVYEQLAPGPKTMTMEGRIAIADMIVSQVRDESEDLDQVHYVPSVKNPEEEILFMEILALTYMFGAGIPRWEQYRESLFKRDWTPVYEAIVDNMKMSMIEKNCTEDQHLLMKCVAHFTTPIPFFNVMCSDEYEPRIVWIHREPIGELSSCFYLLKNVRARYGGDIGLDDKKYLQDMTVKINEMSLKNAVEARKKWIAAKPERAKQIIDIGFREMIEDPVGTSKKIYDYFGMEFTEEMEKGILETVEKKDPQGNQGRKKKIESDFDWNVNEIREQYRWYYEEFKEYLPDFWN